MIQTKHGNIYSDREWAEMMGNWANEIAQVHDEMEIEEAIIAQGKAMLEGVAGENAYTVAYNLYYGEREVRFTDPTAAALAQKVSDWMSAEASKRL